MVFFFFFQAEDGIRDLYVTGVQTCALPISRLPTRRIALAPASQVCVEIAVRREINIDRRSAVPIGRDLQDGGAADPSVGEEHLFLEGLLTAFGRRNDFAGNSGQTAPPFAVQFAKDERDERRARRVNGQAELPGQVITKGGRADFRNRESAGGYDQARRLDGGGRRRHSKGVSFSDLADFCVELDFNSG